MKTRQVLSVYVALLISVLLNTGAGIAQKSGAYETRFSERNLSGPRLGMTWIAANKQTEAYLKSKNLGTLISQFGWHFEYQVIPEGGGPQFLVEIIPMVGGVEYGTLIPSTTLGLGIRLPDGFEFGLGPNLQLGGPMGASTALMAAIGYSFDYGGVSIPINLAWVRNDSGSRFSLVIGYAID